MSFELLALFIVGSLVIDKAFDFASVRSSKVRLVAALRRVPTGGRTR